MRRSIFVIALIGLAALVLPAARFASAQAQTPLQNGNFDQGLSVWQTFALDQKTGDADTLYWPPTFKTADDPQRQISGSTLQIDAYEFAKWQAGIYQVVSVPPGAELSFTARFSAFTQGKGADEHDSISVRLGLDPKGGEGCAGAVWGDLAYVGHLEQIGMASPKVIADANGRATVCIQGETQYALYKNALFADDVALQVTGGQTLPPLTPQVGGLVVGALVVTPAPPDPALAGLVGGGSTSAATAAPSSPDPALSGLVGRPQVPGETGGSGWIAAALPIILLASVIAIYSYRRRTAR